MKIGIDGNEANIENRVGVGQYAYNIISQLHQHDTTNHYYIYLKSQPLTDLPPENDHWHYIICGPSQLWTRFALPLKLFTQQIKLDYFFSPSHYSPLFSPCPTIPTIHDLGYLDSLDQFNKKDIYQLVNWTRQSIQKAHHIIAVSEFTKNEIHRIYHIPLTKISVIPNGVGDIPQFSTLAQKKVLKKFNINSPYFLTLGTLKPNKNIPFLLSAFSQTNEKLLVIAGKKGWLFNDIFTIVKKLKLQKRVIFTDYITENEKWILLKNATATVLPSTYEGFGIPAIESLYSGTSVIASDIPAYRETLSHDVTYIDPQNQTDLIAALNQTKSKRLVVVEKKYTWTNSAKLLITLFSKI
ncbi:MAG: glycosyltransferase family 1 protein [Microgenomates group bacterium]